MTKAKAQQIVLHYPRLDTVLMIEETIKNAKNYPNKAQLFRSLPKKTMYQTYCVIMDYLEESGKIGIDRLGHIAWIWNPELVEKYMAREDLSWRPKK